MSEIELVNAIRYLKPNAEFSFTDNDYSTIKWDVLEGEAPTWQQIQQAHQSLQEAKAQSEADELAKKSAALAKLEALGLDVEDLKALGLG